MHLLDDMALFVEVVKAKSFTKAAENLDMPKSTLSVRINKLEEGIGLRLLNRTTRKVDVTEAGQLYFEKAAKIIEEANLAHVQLTEMLENPEGVLRVSAPVDFAYHFIAPLLNEFSKRYPRIQLDFDVNPRKVDLISEPYDLAIRAGELQDSTLVARRLVTLSSGIYASPDYLMRHGEPQTLDELVQHRCLCLKITNNDLRLLKGKEEKTITVQASHFANSMGMLLHLAEYGLGITLLPNLMAKSDMNAGRLMRLFPEWQAPEQNIYAVTATRLLPRKTQVFIDFLKEKLGGSDGSVG